MKRMIQFLVLFSLLPCFAGAGEVILKDDFSVAKKDGRRAVRGPWKFSGNVASCIQDDELYKKYKDHGPIIFYDLSFEDAVISFSFQPRDAKTVVFTANGEDGHVFRFVLSKRGLGVRAFPPDGEKKSIAAGQEKDIILEDGKWVDVTVKLQGENATVKLGDSFEKTYSHASFDRAKKNLSIGFSFGSLQVKDWVVTK